MKRFLSSILMAAFVLALGTATTFAKTMSCPAGESYVKGYTKSDGSKVAGYCRSAESGTSMKSAATPAAMATGASMKSHSMSSSGTASKSSSAGAMMKSCPSGQVAVSGYTKADGTKVASYCRKSPG